MILFTKGTWLLLAAAAAASSALSVSAPGFFSAPGSAAPRPQLAKRWVSSFLGGATIDVAQPAGAGPATEPAVYSVAATWNVPLIAPNPGANLSDADNRHSVGHWVGITGGQCAGHPGGALFQAGTLSFLGESGVTTSMAWVEWLPDGYQILPTENMTVNPGDVVRVSLRLDTPLDGYLAIENQSTGRKYLRAVSNPQPTAPGYEMCLGNGTAWYMAEWTQAGASPEAARATRPAVENVTFAGVEAVARARDDDHHGDPAGRRLDLADPAANYWNTTQPTAANNGTALDGGRPVFVAEPRDSDAFVLYTPEGKDRNPHPRDAE